MSGGSKPPERWPSDRLGDLVGQLAVAAVPAYFIVLMLVAIAGRFLYPYDLEWMEGGLLHHAQRLSDGQSLYPPPSVDFIPYLYTPGYPALLAGLGKIFTLGYALGRAVSVLALLGIAATTFVAFRRPLAPQRTSRTTATLLAVTAVGYFAAAYPMMEGWYDLVRADTLFLAMVTVAIALAPRLARYANPRAPRRPHVAMLALGVWMGLAFFTKQTGILYVAWVGAVVLVANWRRVPAYVVGAGAVGLGGTFLYTKLTNGWFWTYVFEIHQAHDFSRDRFQRSFGYILWHFPAATLVIAVAFVAVLLALLRTRRNQPAYVPLLLWLPTYGISTLVGAVGWGTEFAHFNAYMPAFLHGGLALAASVLALPVAVRTLWVGRSATVSLADATAAEIRPAATDAQHAPPAAARTQRIFATMISFGVAGALAISMLPKRYAPLRFVPTPADRAAGDALIARLRAVNGEVWVPFHPWYSVLAGKRAYVHRMGIKDVSWRKPRPIAGLAEALRQQRFAAIVFDNRSAKLELPDLRLYYRPVAHFDGRERPRVFTGANVVPESLWEPMRTATTTDGPGLVAPNDPPAPAGVTVLFDFEHDRWPGWQRSGVAWGNGPVALAMASQELVYGFGGARFATSYTPNDDVIGRVTSPPFVLQGRRLTLKLGGGTDPQALRVELVVAGVPIATLTPQGAPSEVFRTMEIDISAHTGETATLVFVDEARGSWGHLNVDDVWLWP